MPLQVASRIEDTFAVLDLTGSLTLGPTLSSLRETTRAVLGNNGITGVILDVGGVTVTDSSGLGELTVVYTITANRNCCLRLVGVTSGLKRMLEMTRIDELLPSCATVDTAKSEIKGRTCD